MVCCILAPLSPSTDSTLGSPLIFYLIQIPGIGSHSELLLHLHSLVVSTPCNLIQVIYLLGTHSSIRLLPVQMSDEHSAGCVMEANWKCQVLQ